MPENQIDVAEPETEAPPVKGRLVAEKTASGYKITGDTYVHRAALKRAGAEWVWDERYWKFKGDIPEEIAALVVDMPAGSAPAPAKSDGPGEPAGKKFVVAGITAERLTKGWRFYGATRPYTRKWNRAGAKWSRKHKWWELEGDKLPKFFEAIMAQEGATPVDQEPPAPTEPEPEPQKPPAPPPTKPVDIVKPSYWDDLLRYMTPGACRPAIALVGPAGNGKTTAAEAACAASGYDYVVIDVTEYTEPADLVGAMSYDPKVGEVWRDGLVTQAFRQGKAVIVNEFDALNPRAALCLQSVCQDPGADGQGRYVTTPGGPQDRVFPKGDCPLICTLNTYGDGPDRQYVGRNALDAATADRFTVVSTGYENEAAILEARGYGKSLAKDLESWARGMRQKIESHALRVILSMRTLLRMAQAVEAYGQNVETAIEKEFLARLPAEVRDLLS